MKKTDLLIAAISGIVLMTGNVRADSAGYLLLDLTQSDFAVESPKPGKTAKVDQKYRILLDAGFFAQFRKNPMPSKSMGTEFNCNFSIKDVESQGSSGVSFSQWFAPQEKGKISTWFWGQGGEKLGNGKALQAMNPVANIGVTYPSWQDLNLGEYLSFTDTDLYSSYTVNVGFSEKYVPEGDPALQGSLLAPILTADHKTYAAGDPQNSVSLRVSCSFQDN